MEPTTPRAAEARALAKRGKALADEGQLSEALGFYVAVVEQFGFRLSELVRRELVAAGAQVANAAEREVVAVDDGTGAVVAWALSATGLTLCKLGRFEGMVAAWDELVARFGHRQDPKIREIVARALYAKTGALARLGRTEAALAAFDAAPAYDELIDPRLALQVAAGMHRVAAGLREAGRTGDELRLYGDLLERFMATDDPELRGHVASAFVMKAYTLGQEGHIEQADRVYEEMFECFRETGGAELSLSAREPARDLAVASMQRAAEAEERKGRGRVAIAHLDGALRILADSDEPVAVRRKLDCLIAKARLLQRGSFHSEATVVLEGAVVAYGELPEDERDGRSLAQALHALLLEVVSVGPVDPDRIPSLVENQGGLLGDVADPGSAGPSPAREPLTDDQIAARLADLNNQQCWLEFATSRDDQSSLAEMADKALELYRITAAWLSDAHDEPDGQAFGAVMMIRAIADGYAMLSRRWSDAERAALPLPSSLLMEFAVRELGIDEWAAELGHPLELGHSDDLAESLLESELELSSDWKPELATDFLTSIHHYEMLGSLRGSARGRMALRTVELQRFAIDRIAAAHRLTAWIRHQQEEAAGVAVAVTFVAQALFVTTHDTVISSDCLFPPRETLRQMLAATGALDWLERGDVDLPGWLITPAE